MTPKEQLIHEIEAAPETLNYRAARFFSVGEDETPASIRAATLGVCRGIGGGYSSNRFGRAAN